MNSTNEGNRARTFTSIPRFEGNRIEDSQPRRWTRNSKDEQEMPIYSMTGFARAQVSVPLPNEGQLSYTLSVKSVNHRFLDVQLRLPSGFDALEMELRKALKDNLVRGQIGRASGR